MTINDISKIIHGKILRDTNIQITDIYINSKLVHDGSLFIALKGKTQDGHDYINEICNLDCIVVTCEDLDISNYKCGVIKVNDTYETLYLLGTYYRKIYKVPVVAITGSVGKTTTKELLSQMLGTKYNVLKSYKNYNNHIGLPLTLFKLNKDIDIVVMEMGMNHIGEIHKLSCIAKPDSAIITNIGTSHIGNLGSKKNIFKAKMEIEDGMSYGNIFVNGYDKFLKKIKSDNYIDAYKVKFKNKDFKIKNIKYEMDKTIFNIFFGNKKYIVTFNVPGKEMLMNLLLAIKTSLHYEIDIENIVEVINTYKTGDSRLEIIKKDDLTIINDCYNASFESMNMILNILKKSKQNKIIILGDILELGLYSDNIHKKLSKKINLIKKSIVLLIGEEMNKISKNIKNCYHFDDNKEIMKFLNTYNYNNSIILIKGSRRMHLEEITEYLKNREF